jgi:hypothetical protein
MNKKTFLQNYKINNLAVKTLNTNLYNKQFIRSDLFNSKHLSLLDNYSNFSVLNKDIPLKLEDGSSLPSRKVKFSHISNKSVQFNKNIFNFTPPKTATFLSSFNNLISSISDTDNGKKTLIIQNPVKAGFNCYALGFSGFLPRRQAINSLKLLPLQFSKGLYASHFSSNKFVKRISFLSTNLTIYPLSFKKNFSKVTTKRKIIAPFYNIVFIVTPKPKLKSDFDKTISDA